MLTKEMTKIGKVLTKNSPTILTGLGVAGLITTTVLAVKATPKAIKILEEEYYSRLEENVKEPGIISNKEVFLLTWKCYIPAAIMGSLTIACIIGANSINLRRNAALASLYSISEVALKEYQTKVIETIGKNKEQKIKDDIAKDTIARNPVSEKEIVLTGHGETLCYDLLSGRYFKSDIEKIRKAVNDISRNMLSETWVTLNDVYYALGLTNTKMGDMIGWSVDDGLLDPKFSAQLTENGTPCLVLDFSDEPRYIYTD